LTKGVAVRGRGNGGNGFFALAISVRVHEQASVSAILLYIELTGWTMCVAYVEIN
jgi:hypothetical protein